MNVLQRILILLQSAARAGLHDLFGEEPLSPQRGQTETTPLDELRYRLEALLPELAHLAQEEKRAGDERRLALDAAARLDSEIDEAITAGDDPRARSLLASQNRQKQQAAQLADRQAALRETRARLQDEINRLENDLEELRRRTEDADARQRVARAIEEMDLLQRESRKALQQSANELERSEELARQAEDRLAARRELREKK